MEIFIAIAEAPLNQRASLLDAACNGDNALRTAVQRLLDADDRSGRFLETPACGLIRSPQPAAAAAANLFAGRRIGAYQVVRLIASGGMGEVYEAVQDQPRRTVALKLLRADLLSDAALSLFHHEAELLGRLRHPSIAQVYEAGTHVEGVISLPYFAMEFVPGAQTITDYVISSRLSLRSRLELFATLCDAVHHGHLKGVVHRDLKPGNVLVDAAGAPKIIDFGVARAFDTGNRNTILTAAGRMVGTLQYMSPEQIRCEPAEIDVRSDIYSLGAMLYEILSHRRPYELGRLTLAEAARTIETVEPPTLASLRRELRGDLSTIVQRAMQKDRHRRYQDAGDMADDIRRYLNQEPIAARPPSTIYQLRKFAARHRALTGAAVISLTALALGTTIATWKAMEATRERNRAQSSARRADRINTFMLKTLSAADPRISHHGVTVREAVLQASQYVEPELADDPEVAAEVHILIGGILERFYEFEAAERHLRLAVQARRGLYGDRHPATVSTLVDLAWVLCNGKPEEAEALFSEALEIHRQLYGDVSFEVAAGKAHIGAT
jgi:serine/threonine protein kinase